MARSAVPGPRGRWLVGDVVAYQRDRIGWLIEHRERYGDVVRLSPQAIVVHDAELAHEVLAATNDVYTIDSILGAGSRQRRRNEAHVEPWMRVRRGVWRSVSERVTQLHLERFVRYFEADLRRRAGGDVDVPHASRMVLGRAIADFCVGGEDDLDRVEQLCTAADNLFVAALEALVSGEGRVAWWPRPAARAAEEANGRLLALLEQLVRGRRAAAEPRDLLDGLAVGISSDEDVQHAVLVLRTIMFASHGVPGAAFSWVALLLAEHPDCAARIAAEAVDAPLTSVAELTAAVPYTSAFLKEALRLYPPQWLLTRSTKDHCTLAGYELAPNTEVLICPYLLHRDPRWWNDPMRFDPNRWLGREQPHARYAYLPFGAGPRTCPGSLLATMQLTVLTVLLARDYRLTMPPLATVRPSTDGLMLPAEATGSWHAVSAGTPPRSPSA